MLGARERSGFELLVVKREEAKESELESEQSEEGERRELASNDHLLFLNKFSYLLEMSRDRESTLLLSPSYHTSSLIKVALLEWIPSEKAFFAVKVSSTLPSLLPSFSPPPPSSSISRIFSCLASQYQVYRSPKLASERKETPWIPKKLTPPLLVLLSPPLLLSSPNSKPHSPPSHPSSQPTPVSSLLLLPTPLLVHPPKPAL